MLNLGQGVESSGNWCTFNNLKNLLNLADPPTLTPHLPPYTVVSMYRYESTEQLVTVTAFTLNSDDEEEEEDEEDKEEDAKAGPDHRGRRPKHMKPGTFKQKLKIPNVVGKGKNQIRLNGKGNIRKRSAQPKQRARKGERKGVGFKGSTGPTGGGSGGKDRGKKGKR